MVDGVYWGNMIGGAIFVNTWGERNGTCVGDREEMVCIARLDVVTHYYLLELSPSRMGCETKEMNGVGGGVGCLVGGR